MTQTKYLMRTNILLFILSLFYIPLFSQPDVAAFDRYVEQAAKQWEVPGLAVAVVKDGKVLMAKGYGVRKLGEQGQVNAQTIYGICSTTKAMTAAAMAILVDEGKVAWDDPVIKHLPEFQLADPFVTRTVRVRDLLTHNAGLANADHLWYANNLGAKEILRRMQFIPLSYPVRGGYTYQNVMYFAAGEVIARVSGMPWSAFVKKRLFEPIGMTNTYPTFAESQVQTNRSTPHYRVKGSIVPIRDMAVDEVGAAGSVWSSVEDMSKWMRFVLDSAKVNGKGLLKPETYAEWLKPQTLVPQDQFYPTVALTKPTWTTYALGWFQHDYMGKTVHFHTGSMDGTTAIIGLLPSQNLGVYVLGNLDHAEVRHALMYKAFDYFGNTGANRDWSTEMKALYDGIAIRADQSRQRLVQQRAPNTKPNLPLADYAGTYVHPLYGEISVTLVNGALEIKQTAELTLKLEHWHFDTFRGMSNLFWDDPYTIQFSLGPNGKVAGMRVGGGEEMRRR